MTGPAESQFTVGNVAFEAVRFTTPIPHWRPRIVETGVILEDGVFDGESRPKLKESIEYFYNRICKGNDNTEFRRQLKIPSIEATKIDQLPDALQYKIEDVASAKTFKKRRISLEEADQIRRLDAWMNGYFTTPDNNQIVMTQREGGQHIIFRV